MNFFTKRLNKKGFTLAELLIVIAIIAILVAIAVPIFTSQLNKAKIARDQANIRSVKGAAIAMILDDASGVDLSTSPWYYEGEIDKDYNIKNVKESTSTSVSEAGKITYPGTIVVEITGTDLEEDDD